MVNDVTNCQWGTAVLHYYNSLFSTANFAVDFPRMLMLPTDRICAKTEKVAPTTMNYISKQSQFLLQEIKLVYGI